MADDLVWTQLPKQPATWTNGIDLLCDKAAEDVEPESNGVHFVNVSHGDLSSLLHSTDDDRLPDSPIINFESRQPAHPPLSVWQSRSAFDLLLGDHDQSSLMLLDYCNISTHFLIVLLGAELR